MGMERWVAPSLHKTITGAARLLSGVVDLGEVGAGDGDGGDGGGFGAEDARAEGDGLPSVLGEEGHLFWGPAAFGTDGEAYIPPFAVRLRRMGHAIVCGWLRDCQGGGEGGGLFGFAKQDAGWGGFLFEDGLESDGVGDVGDVCAAGLF
jgi:hypothetical protein